MISGLGFDSLAAHKSPSDSHFMRLLEVMKPGNPHKTAIISHLVAALWFSCDGAGGGVDCGGALGDDLEQAPLTWNALQRVRPAVGELNG